MNRKKRRLLNTVLAVELVFAMIFSAYGLYIAFGGGAPYVSAMSDAAPGPPADITADIATSAPTLPETVPGHDTPPPSTAPALPQTPQTRRPTMIFCGDVLIDGSVVRAVVNRHGLDAVFPEEFRAPFQDADITMIDLEMPISARGTPVPGKEYTFRGDPYCLALLEGMGVDIVTLANNHTLDYGRDAFLDTLELLDQSGIKYVGGGRDKEEAMAWRILPAGDKKVAILAASRVIPAMDWYAAKSSPGLFGAYDPAELNAQIALAKKEADYVVVFLHWGVEKNTVPEKYQRNMAYGYIDAGADAVMACHPHVLQGFEFYRGRLIAYSLGNFIFTDAKKDTAALELTINGDGSLSARLYPFEITNRSTAPMTDADKLTKLREHLNNISFGAVVSENFEIMEVPS